MIPTVPTNGSYPRPLRARERELLEFVLPAESPGYREYRELIKKMVVLAEGRRGKGNFVLGFPGGKADNASPLESVIAYGMVETPEGDISITVREFVAGQIDVEIVSPRGEEIPVSFEERRRWTYSTWRPGSGSPQTGGMVREVAIASDLTMAFARDEKRLWLYDHLRGMNLLIPVTSYYTELMTHRKIRDPEIALRPSRLFDELDRYSGEDLRSAFLAYNNIHPKVVLDVHQDAPRPSGVRKIVMRMLGGNLLHE